MSNWPIISLAIFGILLVTVLVLTLKVRKLRKTGQEIKPDYRALFFMGITFSGAGVALAISLDNPGMYGMTAMGVIYMVMGLANRDKWENKTS